jgi:hypothetical protein
MKKRFAIFVFGIISLIFMSFSAHKFYTAIYKIDFNASKKRVEITTRIFTDDLNVAISKKYNRKSNLASASETSDDIEYLKKYLNEKIILKVNGKNQPIRFLSKELNENVLICYFNCDNISKIKTFEITNNILTDLFDEQQNIVQLNINSKKQTLLLTSENNKGMLK